MCKNQEGDHWAESGGKLALRLTLREGGDHFLVTCFTESFRAMSLKTSPLAQLVLHGGVPGIRLKTWLAMIWAAMPNSSKPLRTQRPNATPNSPNGLATT